MCTYRFSVTGKVQGVFFRASTKDKADELGLNGWVKNMPDGSVEVHAEGDEHALLELEKWLHVGPLAARVEHVVKKEDQNHNYSAFLVRS